MKKLVTVLLVTGILSGCVKDMAFVDHNGEVRKPTTGETALMYAGIIVGGLLVVSLMSSVSCLKEAQKNNANPNRIITQYCE